MTDHQHHHTLADKNQAYWNIASKSVFKEQWIQDLQQQIGEHLESNVDWIGVRQGKADGDTPTKLLDYACGNGLPSQVLQPYFDSCIGLDVSEGMLEKYNTAAREQGLSKAQMHSVHGDIMASDLKPSLLTEELFNFDLVVICMALHHLENPPVAVQKLVERLKVGGILLVIDWATSPERYQQQLQQTPQSGAEHAPHDHDHGPARYAAAHTVAHDSFAKEQMEEAFKNAGCSEIDFVLHPRISVVPGATTGKMQLFFARGRKEAK